MAMAESDPEMQYMSGSSGGQHDVALRHQPHILKERTPFKKNHFVPPGTANRDTAISYKRLSCRGKKQQEPRIIQELDSLLYFARTSRQISRKDFQEEQKNPVS